MSVMEVTVRDSKLREQRFTVEPDMRVGDLEQELFEAKNLDLHDGLCLIYKGKVLKPTDSFESLDLKPNSFLMVHIRKQRQPVQFHQQLPSVAQLMDAHDNVQSLLNMGFSETKCREALAMTNDNLERAVSILLGDSRPIQVQDVESILTEPELTPKDDECVKILMEKGADRDLAVNICNLVNGDIANAITSFNALKN